ncbi:MAG: tetratricopeptide repeat protein, partial [Candidatus Kapabacteria bacterium]|nr:tetratricopeptide repeat protein [Candidatus Kapabacteria bacterium]
VQYVQKLFIPANLSAFYPYPEGMTPEHIPPSVAGSAFLVTLSILAVIIAWRRRASPTLNAVVFGLAFFIVTISIVLQIVGVGGAAYADRYTYVPFIGLFAILGWLLHKVASRFRVEAVCYGLIVLVSCAFAFQSNQRIGVWSNSDTLWSDVIRQYPYEFRVESGTEIIVRHGVAAAYLNRAQHYIYDLDQFAKALADVEVLLRAKVKTAIVYRTYASALRMLSRHAEAVDAFTEAMRLGDRKFDLYRGRGTSYMYIGRYDEAERDFLQALKMRPSDSLSMARLKMTRSARGPAK